MRAGYIEREETAYFREDADEPKLSAPDQVKIRVKVTGICGSEVHAYHNRHQWRIPPLVSGHEFAGVVSEVGRDVKGLRPGDRVTAEPQYGCGRCQFCREGRINLCRDKRILGASYWSGSFGEYVVVPERCVIPLPEAVSFDEGALIEPLAVGMHAVRMHHVGFGDTVAVIGCGTIGLGVILSACCFHPNQIIAIDIMDFNLSVAKRMGATAVINSATQDVAAEIARLTEGHGVDITLLAFGSPSSLKQAAEITIAGGIIADIAVMHDDVPAPLNQIQVKELQLCGSSMYTAEDFKAVLEAINTGQIKLDGFISKRFPIEQMREAMDWADRRPEPVVKIVMDF